MNTTKIFLALMALLAMVISNVEAVEFFPLGDMETGAAVPEYFSGSPWYPSGSDLTASTSSDTPDASLQSLRVLNTSASAYGVYAIGKTDHTVPTPLPREMSISFDYKGAISFKLDEVYIAGGSSDLFFKSFNDDTTTWESYSRDFTISAGVNRIGVRVYDANHLDSDAVDNLSITAIPEPATMTLLGIGGLALLLRRRRK